MYIGEKLEEDRQKDAETKAVAELEQAKADEAKASGGGGGGEGCEEEEDKAEKKVVEDSSPVDENSDDDERENAPAWVEVNEQES